jgi:hypothetical protein
MGDGSQRGSTGSPCSRYSGAAENSQMCPVRAAGSTWMAALLLLPCLGFCSFPVAALDDAKNGWEEFITRPNRRWQAIRSSFAGQDRKIRLAT